jgi:hypothetical protein
MLTTTHILAVVLIGLLLNLNRDEWFIALMFGVAIDLDHVFAAPRYISDNGLAAILRPSWDDGSGLPWRSLMHSPVFAFVVIPLSVGWRFFLPLLLWGTHLGMDYIESATIPHSTPIDIGFMTACSAGIVFLVYRHWSDLRPDSDFNQFVSYLSGSLRASLKGWGVSIRQFFGSI